MTQRNKYLQNTKQIIRIYKQSTNKKYDQNKAYNPMIKVINSKEIRYLI